MRDTTTKKLNRRIEGISDGMPDAVYDMSDLNAGFNYKTTKEEINEKAN